MVDKKIVCDNCGSSFNLVYDEDEVSYSPSHCTFCGDYYENENEELDFNEEEDSDYFEEETDEDSDDNRWH